MPSHLHRSGALLTSWHLQTSAGGQRPCLLIFDNSEVNLGPHCRLPHCSRFSVTKFVYPATNVCYLLLDRVFCEAQWEAETRAADFQSLWAPRGIVQKQISKKRWGE